MPDRECRFLQEQREQLLVSGFDGYVSKPIELTALNAELKRVTSQGETCTNQADTL